MIQLRKGSVKKIIQTTSDYVEVLVDINGRLEKAIHYPQMIGPIHENDMVCLNTTAVHLGLGTGGYHFVTSNESTNELNTDISGHIMKMKYTPMQLNCNSVEEEYGSTFNQFDSLKSMPVLVGSIHSMLAPAAAMIKSVDPSIKIAYIMTDGGALPIAFSNTVRVLKSKGLIDATITSGNAFGGDYEAVNMYTSLITAKEIAKCDAAIIIMGPGHIGTNTSLGFTGMEVIQNMQIVHSMEGIPIAIPRVSFGDPRERHFGISHHFLTSLGKYCLISVHMGFPIFENEYEKHIREQYSSEGFERKHQIHFIEEETIHVLKKMNLFVTTMGRGIEGDPYFFRTAGACGKLLTEFL